MLEVVGPLACPVEAKTDAKYGVYERIAGCGDPVIGCKAPSKRRNAVGASNSAGEQWG